MPAIFGMPMEINKGIAGRDIVERHPEIVNLESIVGRVVFLDRNVKLEFIDQLVCLENDIEESQSLLCLREGLIIFPESSWH